MMDLRPPYIWPGGKRRVAPQVWAALGNVQNFCEPFAGALAVLLGRPQPFTGCETVNDLDGFITCFWRGVQNDPELVAHYADWPVNETDVLARHLWLNEQRADLTKRMELDPEWYDPKVAGWWVWGVNAWLGTGWCRGDGAWSIHEGTLVKGRKEGKGAARQRPHLADLGRGVNSQTIHDYGISDYMVMLAERMQRVRVTCGDWSRCVTNAALDYGTKVGVFLDPPYQGDERQHDLYATDDHSISHKVREWALAHGDDPRYRIVLAGYLQEHDALMPEDWVRLRWSGTGAYQNSAAVGRQLAGQDAGNLDRRHSETLWFSPHCVLPDDGVQLPIPYPTPEGGPTP